MAAVTLRDSERADYTRPTIRSIDVPSSSASLIKISTGGRKIRCSQLATLDLDTFMASASSSCDMQRLARYTRRNSAMLCDAMLLISSFVIFTPSLFFNSI